MSLLKLPDSISPIGQVLKFNQKKHWNEGYVEFNLDILPAGKSVIFKDNLYVIMFFW